MINNYLRISPHEKLELLQFDNFSNLEALQFATFNSTKKSPKTVVGEKVVQNVALQFEAFQGTVSSLEQCRGNLSDSKSRYGFQHKRQLILLFQFWVAYHEEQP